MSGPFSTVTDVGSSTRGMPSAMLSLSMTGIVTLSWARTTATSSCTIGSAPSRAGRCDTSISPVVVLVPSLTVYLTVPARGRAPVVAGSRASMRTHRPW